MLAFSLFLPFPNLFFLLQLSSLVYVSKTNRITSTFTLIKRSNVQEILLICKQDLTWNDHKSITTAYLILQPIKLSTMEKYIEWHNLEPKIEKHHRYHCFSKSENSIPLFALRSYQRKFHFWDFLRQYNPSDHQPTKDMVPLWPLINCSFSIFH